MRNDYIKHIIYCVLLQILLLWSSSNSSDLSEFKPEALIQYEIRKVEGTAAGYFLTYTSDIRNVGSYWVHLQKSDGTDEGEKWGITFNEYKGQTCYKIEALHGVNKGRMLVAHSDNRANGDGRVLVHSADHREGDECWVIQGVRRQGVSVGYTIVKSTERHRGKYLIASEVRDDDTFWVDVTDNVQVESLWQITADRSKNHEEMH
ncbi:uncharacterized protein LOC134822176 [Bolinopsis microptera]|uniref:uncharacterized protein LOC134822176 n=1 Tax=Bolinopsis microptera TaxID=2820187 RepID=UPI00307952CE